ncbi:protein PTHB1 isoform X1 [Ostrinia furnacalis]|uniref:protein PTHB1 isoform X1 n=2 Tax=Ostrinia furnacalis TaxID=93504 RepID=UPI00103CE7A7|nr:protein PTHB1 isoform X1 [Ostrinia furnacalis]XP_028176281.1 protein PTHB1 isoform X1 [Ostrinia furnacalis]
MSIFKIKHWWSNNKLQESNPCVGIQNSCCLKVDKFNSHTESDCIVVGEEYYLRIFKPSLDEGVSNTLLETQLSDVILQIDTGKFIADSDDRHIIVLHPLNYTIYHFNKKDGHTDAGEQTILRPMIKHNFTRKAYSLTCGPFGNVKTRDLFCIQGLDGSLSFFDQDTFLFMCIFQDVIIPGPVCYIPSCDSFIIGKSTWILEIYSYQQLREFSEISLRQNKKNMPQWVYNAGEEISSVQVIQTSSNFSTIVALGERHLYCFQDNGLMKYMIKFDFMPICFSAYLIGWYYEPGARLLVMVASEDSKLYIYEGTMLLWCCDLLGTAISISRCFLKSLPGGLVTLSDKGVINVGYLGTEPDLNANAAPAMNDTLDPEQVQAELETVEEELQAILESKGDTVNSSLGILQALTIKADVGKPAQNLFQQYSDDKDVALHLLMCPVVVMLTCEDPQLIQNIQITYVCTPPFACSESTICLENINGTEIIESQVFLTNYTEISDTKAEILFTITDNIGKIVVLSRSVVLPISLYCILNDSELENPFRLNILTNQPCIEFSKIFTDFSEEELYSLGNSSSSVNFMYRSTKKTVVLRATDALYSIEAEDFPEMSAVLGHLIYKLADHFLRMGVKDFKFNVKMTKELFKQMTFKFLKSVETHAKDRMKLKGLEEELNVLQKQFTVVQKRLLVQYGSLPPGDCDPLEFLMRDTHERLIKCADEILVNKDNVCRAGCTLITMGNLIIYIFKQTGIEEFKIKLIEEMLCLTSLYESYQEWEEAVTQSLSYILNKVFNNTEKDKEKLAPVTEQGILSHINLKRFMKQLRIVLEKLYSEAYEDADLEDKSREKKIERIEEIVEVL